MAFRGGESEGGEIARSWAVARYIAVPYAATQIAAANPNRLRLTIIPNQSQAVYLAPTQAGLPASTGVGAGQNGFGGALFGLFKEGGSPIIVPLNTQAAVWACNDGVTGTGLDVTVIEELG